MTLFDYYLQYMTEVWEGMTAIEVEIFLTLVVPYLAALTFYNMNIEKRRPRNTCSTLT